MGQISFYTNVQWPSSCSNVFPLRRPHKPHPHHWKDNISPLYQHWFANVLLLNSDGINRSPIFEMQFHSSFILAAQITPLSFIFHKAFISPDCATCLPQWAWAGTLFCTARMFRRSIYGVGSAENIVRLNKTRFNLAAGFERWLNRLIAPSREHENCLCAPNSHLKTTWSAMF